MCHSPARKERKAAMTIQWTRTSRAIASMVMLLLAACASHGARFPVQQYVPTTTALLPLGQLFLSNTQLQFAALSGMMPTYCSFICPSSAANCN